MINVDVFVPAINHTYNCKVDEEARISVLVEELTELISKKERNSMKGDQEVLLLGSVDKGTIFEISHSLKDYSIKNGETLILV